MQVEDGVGRRTVCVRHGAVQTADGPVTARVECGRVGDELPAAEVGVVESGLDLGSAAEVAQRVVREVAADAARGGASCDVLRTEQCGEVRKGPVGETATAAAVGEIEGGSADETGELRVAQVAGNEGAIATKTVDRVEDRRGEEGGLGTGVECPIPVGLAETEVPAAGPEGLLILGKEQAVVRVEDALQ